MLFIHTAWWIIAMHRWESLCAANIKTFLERCPAGLPTPATDWKCYNCLLENNNITATAWLQGLVSCYINIYRWRVYVRSGWGRLDCHHWVCVLYSIWITVFHQCLLHWYLITAEHKLGSLCSAVIRYYCNLFELTATLVVLDFIFLMFGIHHSLLTLIHAFTRIDRNKRWDTFCQ